MLAMALTLPRGRLVPVERPLPDPGPGQLRVRVRACAVCRTDLHLVDDELPGIRYPIVPGHEIVGVVDARGAGASTPLGARVGIPWLGHTCGRCEHCTNGRENLCDQARFTGYQIDGGYAEYTVADERFCLALPDGLDDVHAAPLLCAGLIGYRALVMTGDAPRLGLYGFGAAAHIVTQLARHQGRTVYAFVRPGDEAAQQFALRLGCSWAGDANARAPVALDAAIIFAPAGELVPVALDAVRKGGTVVCGGIHMSDIPSFPYSRLWGERVLRSVANLTRRDGVDFLRLAPRVPVRTEVTTWPLTSANEALEALRAGRLSGAAVLVPPAAA
ncbi:MAG TPA: zinc-dependent alcohol dehydrogenase family protein [Steroidobacteraceae bacterium]|nr:zinc-dependent alcohol dehydrogenase family protein [Steroidobacteraceae bacterium]